MLLGVVQRGRVVSMTKEPFSMDHGRVGHGVHEEHSVPSNTTRNALSQSGSHSFLATNSGTLGTSTARRSQNFEIVTARNELKKKMAEVKMLKKTSDIVHAELKTMEGNFDELKDSIDAKEKMAVKKQRIMAKLNITNQMLIQTLNTLELKTDILDGFISTQMSSKKDDSALIMTKNNDTYLQNLKLKESLLNLTRDHYRAADGIRHMGTGIEELRLSLQGKLN